MNEKKKLRRLPKRILSFVMTLAMMLTLMPGMSMEAYAAEPAGRGKSWDILYSEVRANGNGKAYPVGTRIYMDINPLFEGREDSVLFMDSYDCAASYGYVSGKYDSDLKGHFFEQEVELSDVLTLQEKYDECTGYPKDVCSCGGENPIQSGGYWIFSPDNGFGDEFYGVVSSGNGGSIPVADLDIVNLGPTHAPDSNNNDQNNDVQYDMTGYTICKACGHQTWAEYLGGYQCVNCGNLRAMPICKECYNTDWAALNGQLVCTHCGLLQGEQPGGARAALPTAAQRTNPQTGANTTVYNTLALALLVLAAVSGVVIARRKISE